MNGDFFEWRNPASSASSSSGNFPANYPNTWLRLKRAGSVFTGFASYDGQTWAQLGSATIAMPSQIYLGFAVDSHSASQLTTAQFGPLADVTNAQNPYRYFGNHVQTSAAHRRQESRICGAVQFQSLVP